MERLAPSTFINYGSNYKSLLNTMGNFAKKCHSLTEGKLCVLISGPQGCGKTSLAALYAKKLDLSFTKFVTCDKIYSFSESQKVDHLIKIF